MIESKHTPALPGHVSCVANLATHQTSPAGSCPVAGCDDDDSGLRLLERCRIAVLHYGLSHPGLQKSLFIFLPTSGLQALKDKRFESKLASEACYFRGGESWHYKDNT